MFSPEERRIFGPFPNGRGQAAFADPVAIYRKLTLYTNGELNTLLEQYQQGDLAVAGVAYRLAEATISAFGLPPFDPATGQGTLEDDALELLREFLDWRDQKKTKPVNSPTSAPSTERIGIRQDMTLEELKAWEEHSRLLLPGHRLTMPRTTASS